VQITQGDERSEYDDVVALVQRLIADAAVDAQARCSAGRTLLLCNSTKSNHRDQFPIFGGRDDLAVAGLDEGSLWQIGPVGLACFGAAKATDTQSLRPSWIDMWTQGQACACQMAATIVRDDLSCVIRSKEGEEKIAGWCANNLGENVHLYICISETLGWS